MSEEVQVSFPLRLPTRWDLAADPRPGTLPPPEQYLPLKWAQGDLTEFVR